uniref:Uncharacterized protein n=1 Tax=Nomascus leucogenys TaxID=61853 RepID=A0A2I3GWM2_NOMLE
MTKAGSKGGNLRDKLDCNELDLSLSDLNEVPVKELGKNGFPLWYSFFPLCHFPSFINVLRD